MKNDWYSAACSRGIAVVQQENVSSLKVTRQLLQHNLRIGLARVEPAPAPAYLAQAEVHKDGVQQGIAQTGGRAEKAWRLPGNSAQCRLGVLYLAPGPERAEKRKKHAMALGVVFDGMPAPDDFAA